MTGLNLDKRKYIIGLVAILIVIVYLLRLLSLQIMSDDYKRNADSNAFLKKIQYPARGLIMDRKGRLLVYNEPAYNIMVIMQEQLGVDTLDFCNTVGITKEQYIERMAEIKDSKKNLGYSRFTPQLFMSQIPAKEFSVFQEKLFKFKGFYVEKRAIRHYATTCAAHVLGDVAEVSQLDVDSDEYYRPGDYIGKLGVEKSYEKDLRGVKGMKIMLRDVHGRIKGHYQDGQFDRVPEPGRNLTLGLDRDLQALGERLMRGKLGSIVAIDPQTGEVLCMVSSPTFDPHLLSGPDRGKNYQKLYANPMKPLLNRAIMGQYPPGSTFKTSQGLTFLQEGIINTHTAYPCYHGFRYGRLHVGCHGHASPAALAYAIQTSCNSYFCWGFYHMMQAKRKYGTVNNAMNRWKDYMVSMGFGYRLGVDLPGEKRGMIPNAEYYDKHYRGSWNGLTVISDAIGQGEVALTPLQIANLCATIANRGYYYIPHVVRSVEGRPTDTTYTRKHYTMVEEKYYNYIVDGMRRAVLGGTCKGANLPGLDVCGKTGTAQNRGRDHSVFIGFAPMNNPRIAISVYVENGGFGAHFAVPIGAVMIEQYLNGHLSPSGEKRAAAFASRTIGYGTRQR
ncbi:MAG: penicillin-binding protein 2 [Bacteroidaceae bacterium]|nr:penicillin-binding protein 2 [Bacteroidaceae bacterium]MBQ2030157.1 penicillin-binding protein 2 [Bacteroidaceae bacterium]